MKTLSILLTLSLICFSFSSFGEPKKSPTEEVENFKPHMLFHENEGCPANSGCSVEMGKRYQKWIDAVSQVQNQKNSHLYLEEVRKVTGVPIDLWIPEKASEEKELIYWESPCRQHNIEGQEKIGIGVAMAKSLDHLKKLEEQKKVFLRRLYRLKNQKGEEPKIEEFFSLRGENPLYLDGDRLIFQRSAEGNYYALSINKEGAVEVIPSKAPPYLPQSMDCPADFVKKIKEVKMPQNLYAGVYCQKTWDMKSQGFETILVGWSCN